MDKNKCRELPLIALRGIVAFPNISFNFDISRLRSIEALENAMLMSQYLFLVAQKDVEKDDISKDDLYTVGTVVKIKQVMRLPGNLIRVSAEGIYKAEAKEILQEKPFFIAEVQPVSEKEDYDESQNSKTEVFLSLLQEAFEEYSSVNGKLLPDYIMSVISSEDISFICNAIIGKGSFNYKIKQEILEENDILKKTEKTLTAVNKEIELLKIKKEIDLKVKAKIDKSQREYFLREQIRVINEELGDKDGIEADAAEYIKRAESIEMPLEVRERLKKEIERLKKISVQSSEGTVSRDYIELILDMPWEIFSKENKNIKKAQSILDKDHYGLEKIKERIVEFLAVRQNADSADVPVICLAGPPGVGKTSIAKSVARALNRKYCRMSLGGISDEAEIRGHRKTYVGAMPGRVISLIKQTKTRNPLILLDEIDKLRNERRGDPAAALLEVLDAEQNFAFRDNYLELPFDISQVLFMCTANNVENIPVALKDRLEIINIGSYTLEEKANIAVKYLIPKQLKKHGLSKAELKFRKDAVDEIIMFYTREAGVRQLERLIGKICRKTVKNMLVGEKIVSVVKSTDIFDFLGPRKFKTQEAEKKNQVGVVSGLAWTSVGGDTLDVESVAMKGKGIFKITGNAGDVMKESAEASISYIRANAEKFGISPDFYEKTDIHVHIPEGAVPKDGPSAGVTMVTSMISALTGIAVMKDVAMTGEITLRGRVLPIGGLKEKVLAAKQKGITTVIVPSDNFADIEELPQYIKSDINFVFAELVDDILPVALEKKYSKVIKKEKGDDDIIKGIITQPHNRALDEVSVTNSVESEI